MVSKWQLENYPVYAPWQPASWLSPMPWALSLNTPPKVKPTPHAVPAEGELRHLEGIVQLHLVQEVLGETEMVPLRTHRETHTLTDTC